MGRPPLWISSERSRGRRACGRVDGVSCVLRWLSRGVWRLETFLQGGLCALLQITGRMSCAPSSIRILSTFVLSVLPREEAGG